ncbi:membrane dipeptidase [Lacinutrix salivirga]
MKPTYIDLHCHPALKPYSKSFKYKPQKQNVLDANRKNSIWHYSPPNFLERQVNRLLTLTKFTQVDLTALAKANCDVVVVSLYPFEKHFLNKRLIGFKFVSDILVNLAAGVSQKRIDYVRNHNSYFEDLNDEYNYYLQLHNFAQKIDNIHFTYRLTKNYNDIITNRAQSSETRRVISLIPTIEGAHAFETGLDKDKNTANSAIVLQNINTVKQWEYPPLFITLAHHFYNEICGHARSITIGLIKKNQNRGLNTDITELGWNVIKNLLDKNNGKRILIDIKHMSTAARTSYYNYLNSEFANHNIPIIVSHGAVNGKRSIAEPDSSDYEYSSAFMSADINFYDSEIIKIAKSKGLFGIQLDERRIGSKKAIARSKVYFPSKKRRLKRKTLLIWRQVKHCALVINAENLFCWDTVAIGSDFDGIINPMKGLWTSENLKDVKEHLVFHANNFLTDYSNQLLEINKISAKEIVERLLFINVTQFLEKNYH